MECSKERKQPTEYTIEQNHKVAKELGIDPEHAQNEELELAKSHCIKRISDLEIKDKNGKTIWKQKDYRFVENEKVPDSVNPSLWINTRCLYETGIYSVVDRDIIQVRGFDLANISFIRSKTGWIVLDAGSTVEGTKAAIEETEKAIGESIRGKIRAVIISHSHGDHFGGIAGVLSPEEAGSADDGKIPIYVAGGFDEATRDEYVYAGAAMGRRCYYQMGTDLPKDAYGKLSNGCGLEAVSGTSSYIHPTNYILEDTTEIIDGITVDFQITNETEAVANMQNYFHQYKALWVADNCIGTLHNIYTMRGAKIRDAKLWSEALYHSYIKYGKEAQVVFQGHAWPHWNSPENPESVGDLLLYHAAMYQYIHDQSLLYLNQGDTAEEIAKKLVVPDVLAKQWYLRPYYGDVEVNARAIYNKYVGFYDANPVHLKPLTPVEEAKKFIEYVGSEEKVLQKARADFEKGDYQYAAQAANYVVFANPDNIEARYLCADAFEQLGYQSESAIIRNAYLKGAFELREDRKKHLQFTRVTTVLGAMDNQQILDYLGMVLDGNQIENIKQQILLKIEHKDSAEAYSIQFWGGALLKERLTLMEFEDRKKEKNGIAIVSVNRKDLIDYIAGDKEALSRFEAEDLEFWKQVQQAIVEVDAYRTFSIVEP